MKERHLLHITLALILSLGIAPGLFAQSIKFDQGLQVPADEPAEGSVVRVSHSDTVNLGDQLTLEAWICPTAFDAAGGRSFIAGKPDTFMHAVETATGAYQAAINAAEWSWKGSGTVDIGPCDTEDGWSHVAASFDGTVYELHVNGKHQDSIEDPGAINTSLGDFTIGWLPQWGEAFTGQIDEVRVSNVARYPAGDFDAPTGEWASDGDTVLLMHFNEGSGDTTSDDSGNENHGTLEGGAEWVATGAALSGGTAVEPNEKLSTTWAGIKSRY